MFRKIHIFIQDNNWDDKARFYWDIDVVTYIENHALEKCNVLIVQYKPKDSPMLILEVNE